MDLGILQPENIWKTNQNQTHWQSTVSLPSNGQPVSIKQSTSATRGPVKCQSYHSSKQSILLLTHIVVNLIKSDEIYDF